MINDTNLTTNAVGLLGSQIFGTVTSMLLGLAISIILAIIAGILGAKSKSIVGKIIGYILAIVGIIGAINFGLSLLKIFQLMNGLA